MTERRYLALGSVVVLLAFMGPLPAGMSAAGTPPAVVISEVHPTGSSTVTYGADWFELTNVGTTDIDITGWKVDDSSDAFGSALPLRRVTSIPAGGSVIFFEGNAAGTTDETIIASFAQAWFGSPTPPDGFLIGSYGGVGIGLGSGGDAVNVFDATGAKVASVTLGAATSGITLDNSTNSGTVTSSAEGYNAAFRSNDGAEVGSPGIKRSASPLTGIDLSTYVRVGRFDLPEPTRTSAPPNSVLAQEASAVAYNWDTDTLFITGDGGRSIVQVTKDGRLIDTMNLEVPGSSPQGTEFFDPEGLTYVGGGLFVMSEERDRQAVLFRYVPGATLTRADTQTVKLGTFVDNIGLEGLSYDPLTGGFIFVKETQPLGIFQTNIDFITLTATNGSAATLNSVNLFDPALLGMSDFGDVFALSNLTSLTGPEADHLLVLSQENGRIVNTDRQGQISSALTIVEDDGTNPLDVPSQQHEGLTVDGNGILYVVSENGGGDFNHPQLWVYAPSSVPNAAPTDLDLINRVDYLPENSNTTARIKVASVLIADDGLGVNNLSVSGPDAVFFEVDTNGLYLKAGTLLDFETRTSYTVTVGVDDPTLGPNPDASDIFTLVIADAPDGGGAQASLVISEVAPWSSGSSPVGADWFEVTNTGTGVVDISGWRVDDSSNDFNLAVALNGVSTIAPGESVIFIETSTLASARTAFLDTWFGTNPPAGLQIGGYSGGGIGLSTGGDAVVLFNGSGTVQAKVTFAASPAGPSFPTFDNSIGLNDTAITALSSAGVYGAFAAVNDTKEVGSPGVRGRLVITEVAPWSSGNSPVGADWFEVTNTGGAPVDITGWKMDDSSESPAAAVPLAGVTTIAPGESVIFLETGSPSTTRDSFLSTWFGATPPPGLQVGSYSGAGVGLSTGGDAVVLYDGAGVRRAKVTFGSSPSGPFGSFDNSAGLDNVGVTLLSVVGVNDAFAAVADAQEIASPGRAVVGGAPPVQSSVRITEVAPWSSGNSPVGADWFEVTNTGTSTVDISGWKVDDSSADFGAALALTGVTSIAPNESVIFIETSDLAATRTSFLSTWFGANAPAGLKIGGYSGSGIGLSTGGDAVVLYNAVGVVQAKVTFGGSPAGPAFPTFDNTAALDAVTLGQQELSVVGINGAFAAVNDTKEIGSPGVAGRLAITEVAPWSSGNSPFRADWFEVSNVGIRPVDITGWKVDDSSESFPAALALTGVTTIAPGESVIFIETSNLAALRTQFLDTWFGGNPPANLQFGSYNGSGVGLSTSGDAVVLFDASGVVRAKVTFEDSPDGPFPTFDNSAARNDVGITQLSAAGFNFARTAVNDTQQIGSPGKAVVDIPAPTVVRGGYGFNRATRQFVQQVTLRNNETFALTGPFHLVLDNLSANATLANKTGTTANNAPIGSPYITVPAGTLALGASVSVTLQFTNPSLTAISYDTRVLTVAP